jgi:hypothetical protein
MNSSISRALAVAPIAAGASAQAATVDWAN